MKDIHGRENETPEIREVLSAVVNTLDRLELGQIELHEEMQGMRKQMFGMEGEIGGIQRELAEVKVSVSVLGTGLRGEMAQLGRDLRSEMGQLANTLRGEIADFRTELKADIQSLSETVVDAMIGLDERITVLEVRR